MSNKVLVPVFKPSQKSTKPGKQVAKAVNNGESPTAIGRIVARTIKRGGRR